MASVDVADPWRNEIIMASVPVHNVAIISGEQFVSTVARQSNGHMLPCQPRDEIGRDHGGIAERLFHRLGDSVQGIGYIRFDDTLVVVSAEALRHGPGIFKF